MVLYGFLNFHFLKFSVCPHAPQNYDRICSSDLNVERGVCKRAHYTVESLSDPFQLFFCECHKGFLGNDCSKGIEQRTLCFFLKNGFQSVQELQRVQYVAVKEYVSYLEKLLNVFAMITIMEKTVNLVTNGCAVFILLQVVLSQPCLIRVCLIKAEIVGSPDATPALENSATITIAVVSVLSVLVIGLLVALVIFFVKKRYQPKEKKLFELASIQNEVESN